MAIIEGLDTGAIDDSDEMGLSAAYNYLSSLSKNDQQKYVLNIPIKTNVPTVVFANTPQEREVFPMELQTFTTAKMLVVLAASMDGRPYMRFTQQETDAFAVKLAKVLAKK